jgi:ubiquinone/menaquinone biosynthesis C-methylase UbiE
MFMNWPERVWIYSPVRVFFQKRELAKWLGFVKPKPHGSALEIGCGLGRGARLLVQQMGFDWVAAFDLEHILVQRAKKRAPSDLQRKISFYTGDAQDLPFRDAQFDSVVNFGIIHHVLDWRKCISELSRVLKPEGLFYFEEIYPPLYRNFLLGRMLRHPTEDRFDGPAFLGELETNGLRLIDTVPTSSKFGIVGAARKI